MPTVTWARVDPARRAAVVAAAEAEFGAHGFSGGSLNVIARRAGVGKAELHQGRIRQAPKCPRWVESRH